MGLTNKIGVLLDCHTHARGRPSTSVGASLGRVGFVPKDVTTTSARPVPVRTILTTIALVLTTAMLLLLVMHLRRILAFILVAAFFAIVLNPLVDTLVRMRMRRGFATGLVFFSGLVLFSSMTYAFVRPIYSEGRKFADNLPTFVDDAKQGRGRVGSIIKRYDIDTWVEENAPKFKKSLSTAGGPAAQTAGKVATGIFGFVTVLVLTFLMLLQAPGIISAFLSALPSDRREQVRRIGNDASRTVSGYMAGNLLISLIAGVTAFIALQIVGVPFAFVMALWVAFADLLPLVGATVGAVPVILIAFLHSTSSGIAMLVVFIAYQQFENHVLQPVVMSRTVKLNPLWVLLSVLVGVELAGIVGALLAIPTAGIIQVVARDVWDERQGLLNP